jgi:ferredoxin-NADP reductase
MAGTAVLERLNWRLADVVEIKPETPRAKTLDMRVPEWGGHLPGQHVDIRLTAEDGYQAQRSYSIASAPGGERLELTVELLEDGEVSPYLAEELRSGDRIELRGPIGGYFTWDGSDPSPLLLIGGGSGVVPLMAMIRHRAAVKSTIPARLLYSSRAWDDVIYREELGRLAASGDGLEVTHTLTRSQPAGWSGHRRRIDQEMLAEVAWPVAQQPAIFVCGPTRLVESVASSLVALGHAPERIKTERFGPSGG